LTSSTESPRVAASITASIATRFKLIRQDLVTYGGDQDAHAVEVIDDLARHLPLVGAMTTRNTKEARIRRILRVRASQKPVTGRA
jgi:hypothetical protein